MTERTLPARNAATMHRRSTSGHRGAISLAALSFLLLTGLFAGCAKSPTAKPDDLTDPTELPFTLQEAWRLGDGFAFRFRRGDTELHGTASSSERPAMTIAPPARGFEIFRLLPLSYSTDAVPSVLAPTAKSLPVLDAEQWQRFRNGLFRQLLPDERAGLVMDFEYNAYFLFYDAAGEFQAVPLVSKPPDYQIQGKLDMTRIVESSRPQLEKLLQAEGIDSQAFVFATGDTGVYALPFLYVDLAAEELVFFQDESLVELAAQRPPGMKTTQALAHMLRSHLSDIPLRPFSTLYRLIFLATDTMLATLRFDWVAGLADLPIPPLSDAAPMNLIDWEAELDQRLARPSTTGKVDILIDGEPFFDRLVARFLQAESSIHLQTYIFDDDDYAVHIAQILKQRSNQGIDVKVLLDGLGTIAASMTDPATLPAGHQSPRSIRQHLQADSDIDVRLKTNPWMTSDHVKVTLIDRETAFIGGMNIGREYRYEWHDLMVELTGPIVDELAREFDRAWTKAGPLGGLASLLSDHRHEPRPPDGESLRILLTAPGNLEIYNTQLAAARRTRNHIYIQNAYFTDDRMLRELVFARRRGVDVRVVIPIETDHGPISRSNVLAANLMLAHGIRVYVYPGFSHVKAALFDGWACLGSANFDRLSLRINRELNIASSSEVISEQLRERLFEPDFAASPELTEPLRTRWVDHLIEIVGDYIY